MSADSAKGQALPEYLLTLAVLLLVAHAGLKAWHAAVQRAEDEQAWTYFLPSP